MTNHQKGDLHLTDHLATEPEDIGEMIRTGSIPGAKVIIDDTHVGSEGCHED